MVQDTSCASPDGGMARASRCSSGELRALSAKCRDGAQVRRLLALAIVLEGAPRTEAVACDGMDRQTLRDWVHRYNEGGGFVEQHLSIGDPPVEALARQHAAISGSALSNQLP